MYFVDIEVSVSGRASSYFFASHAQDDRQAGIVLGREGKAWLGNSLVVSDDVVLSCGVQRGFLDALITSDNLLL